jgi:hypothetical protein
LPLLLAVVPASGITGLVHTPASQVSGAAQVVMQSPQ